MALVMGINRDPGEWNDTELVDARGLIRTGLRKFNHPIDPRTGEPWQWRFFEKRFNLSASPAFDSGTIGVTGGVVTLTGSTWPAYAASSFIRVGGFTLFVTEVTNTTHLVVSNTAVVIDPLSEYALYRYKFAMPDDFGELLGGVTYFHPDHNRPLRGVQEHEIPLRYTVDFQQNFEAVMFAIQSPQDIEESDNPYYLLFWPGMEEESMITGIYRAEPLDRLDDVDIREDGDIIQCNSVHAETMLAAIMAACEEYYNDEAGLHTALFEKLLINSINHDRRTAGPIEILKKNSDRWVLDDHITVDYEVL